MGVPRALQSTEAQRLRQNEIERRILPIKIVVAVVLWIGLGLLALSHPWSDVVATAILGGAFVVYLVISDRRARHSRAPLLWLAGQELGVIAILAFVMTWSGGPDSAAIPMLIPIAIILGTRFPLTWLVPLVGACVAMAVSAMVVGDVDALRDAPVQALSWIVCFCLAAALAHMLAKAERRARKDAVHDALTGVLNRKALEVRIDRERERPSRRAETLSVIAADLDGFKEVNDACGHDAGDAVLRAVARALADAIRAQDQLYRLGGDEFVVLLPGTATVEAAELAERLRATVRALRPDGHAITLSAGVAGVVHERLDLEHLISRADRALYAAKAAGRDRVELADLPGMPTPAAT